MYELDKANRGSGSWVTGYCPYRAVPCGNPICADEAMRASELKFTGDFVAEIQAHKAYDHAVSIANKCAEEGHACPFGNLEDRLKILAKLSD